MTVDDVKDILGISGTGQDARITTLLPLTKDFVIDYCNNKFLDEDGDEVLPSGIKLAIADLIGLQINRPVGISSEKLGDYSVSYYLEGSNLPPEIQKRLSTYKKVRTA